MLKTDYKFWYITRNDNGFITEAGIRFYEGDITTKNELVNEVLTPVTRYRRTKRLKKINLKHLDKKFKKESSGKDAKVYNQSDFGQIKTDDELRSFLNKEIKKDKTRQAIDEQK